MSSHRNAVSSHRNAQDLSKAVYLKARQFVLKLAGDTAEQLDAVYAEDAAKLKRELRALFLVSGIPEVRAGKLIDAVLEGSRERRIDLVKQAIEAAAKTARGLDQKTFEAIFGADEAAKDPLAAGRSASPPTRTPSLQLVGESEDSPPSTD